MRSLLSYFLWSTIPIFKNVLFYHQKNPPRLIEEILRFHAVLQDCRREQFKWRILEQFLLPKVSEFLPHPRLAKVSMFSNPNVGMLRKINICNDLNRNKFLSLITAAQSFLPGLSLSVKSRKWLERQSWGKGGSNDLHTRDCCGPLGKPGETCSFLEWFTFSVANLEMLSQVPALYVWNCLLWLKRS